MTKLRWFTSLIILIVCGLVIFFSLENRRTNIKAVALSQVDRAIQVSPRIIERTKGDLPPEPTKEGNQNHFHVSLRLTVEGGILYPPRDVGLTDREFLAIHTHDRSGVIHFHQPLQNRKFRLSDIWKAWGISTSKDSFAGLQPVCIYNNGEKIVGNPVLKNMDNIQVDFAKCGTPAKIPKFDWKAQNVFLEGAK